MAKVGKQIKDKKQAHVSPFNEFWTKRNYILLFSGIGILLLGYYLMAQSPWDNFLSLAVSPVVLLVGYLIIIPIAILYKSPSSKRNKDGATSKG